MALAGIFLTVTSARFRVFPVLTRSEEEASSVDEDTTRSQINLLIGAYVRRLGVLHRGLSST